MGYNRIYDVDAIAAERMDWALIMHGDYKTWHAKGHRNIVNG